MRQMIPRETTPHMQRVSAFSSHTIWSSASKSSVGGSPGRATLPVPLAPRCAAVPALSPLRGGLAAAPGLPGFPLSAARCAADCSSAACGSCVARSVHVGQRDPSRCGEMLGTMRGKRIGALASLTCISRWASMAMLSRKPMQAPAATQAPGERMSTSRIIFAEKYAPIRMYVTTNSLAAARGDGPKQVGCASMRARAGGRARSGRPSTPPTDAPHGGIGLWRCRVWGGQA